MSRQPSSAPGPDLLFYANPELCADLLWLGRFAAPDPFLALRLGGRSVAVLSPLEFARGRRESAFDEVLALESLEAEACARFGEAGHPVGRLVRLLAERHGAKAFTVPEDFPAAIAFDLVKHGLEIHPGAATLLPQRLIKSSEEAGRVREGNDCSAAGLRAAERVLREAEIGRGGRLRWKGRALTSELLRAEVNKACVDAGGMPAGTIVAGGDQGVDCHERGHGPLHANEFIIVDVFPRMDATGYHGDMTRTFLKGRASPEQRRQYAAVREAQKRALGAVRAGVHGSAVHAVAAACFKELGYESGRDAKGYFGFYHGTGHGLGLEIHEPLRMRAANAHGLRAGMVVTVEPGLYYLGRGGVRIEDVVWVTDDGCEPLSKFHYRWEIA